VSLAFLTPDAPPARDRRARSPMERPALAAGARLSLVEGWNVPNAYAKRTSERERATRTVGFADRSSLTKLELQAQPRTLARVLARASSDIVDADTGLDPGTALRSADGELAGTWWCGVTPSRALLLTEPAAGAALRAAVAQAAREEGMAAGEEGMAAGDEGATAGEEGIAAGNEGTTAGVVEVTCGLAALALAGPLARELLARFCAIDVRERAAAPGSFRPGSVARTPGYVLVEAPERLLVLVGWALGEYLWEVAADAAERLGGGPIGAEALAHVQEHADA